MYILIKMRVSTVASFDIGKKTFTWYVEEFSVDALKSIQGIPKDERYCKDGTPTPCFAEILDQVYMNGTLVAMKTCDLTITGTSFSKIILSMTNVLDEQKTLWNKCDTILIERQMAFKGKYNIMALKLAQHCWSYFSIKYGGDKIIIDIPAWHKTMTLGAEKVWNNTKKRYENMGKYQRKKWTEKTAKDILELRDDESGIELLESDDKQDDRADSLSQLQAYKIIKYIKT
jgi:hypothetical protein